MRVLETASKSADRLGVPLADGGHHLLSQHGDAWGGVKPQRSGVDAGPSIALLALGHPRAVAVAGSRWLRHLEGFALDAGAGLRRLLG